MRIATWNCFKGECRSRSALLETLRPDIVILQECSAPIKAPDDRCLWFGNRGKGIGVLSLSEMRLIVGPISPDIPDSVFPVIVDGPVPFHLLAVWTQKRPSYIGTLFEAVDRYKDFLRESPSVIVGDFNSHPRWDSDNPVQNHSAFVDLLEREFGIVSAYHNRSGYSAEAPEEPTLYWRWNELKPFHIDYCFIPKAWLPRLRSVEVGSFAEWSSQSDHRPLVTDIDIDIEESDPHHSHPDVPLRHERRLVPVSDLSKSEAGSMNTRIAE